MSCTPILLHIVTSSSPTVLESSTMMVLMAPSSILIFCGRCFFLYSRISCQKGRKKMKVVQKQEGARKREERNAESNTVERWRAKGMVGGQKKIKYIQVVWRERGSMGQRKPYLTAAYQGRRLRFQSQQWREIWFRIIGHSHAYYLGCLW